MEMNPTIDESYQFLHPMFGDKIWELAMRQSTLIGNLTAQNELLRALRVEKDASMIRDTETVLIKLQAEEKALRESDNV